VAKADLLLVLTNERTRLVTLARDPRQTVNPEAVLHILESLKVLDDHITRETARV